MFRAPMRPAARRAAVRGQRLAAAACLLVAAGASTAADTGAVLRLAMPLAAPVFDPVQASDARARQITAHLFEAPLEYDYMAVPPRLRPNTAAAMPRVSADFRTFRFTLRRGIHFIDDAAFHDADGRPLPRELVAQDYVYTIKRIVDPRWNSPSLPAILAAQVLGLAELRQRALATRQPLDYDLDVPGLRVLDRYTFEVRLARPSPRFLDNFSDGGTLGATAREVVERHGSNVGEHPVGTGPFRLGMWRRGSRLTLLRHAGWRERRHDEHPPPGDTVATAAADALRGRRLPLLDGVEIDVVDAAQPRWLAFLQGRHDVLDGLPAEYQAQALPGGRLAPDLQRRGVQAHRRPRDDVTLSCFNMDDPVVGGLAPAQVALRRAVSLALDVAAEIRLVRGGQALPAQSPMAPGVYGHDPAFKTEHGDHDPARARALLQMFGWLDRDGDGWREQPDGSPLLLRYTTADDRLSRQLAELWTRQLAAVGLRTAFSFTSAASVQQASRAGALMMWSQGWRAGVPDGEGFLELAYGPSAGEANRARFRLPAYDALYERQAALPDGPERAVLMREALRLWVAYVPCKAHVHRIGTDLVGPRVLGYHLNPYVRDGWKYLGLKPQP